MGRCCRIVLTALSLLVGGCGGYAMDGSDPRQVQVGSYTMGSIHPADVRSVHVEIFNNQDFRRELEFRLTEAVQKRILTDTPYRLTDRGQADTILYGEIAYLYVVNLGNDFRNDLPLEAQPVFVCHWTWKDRRNGEILASRRDMKQASEYIPLGGETFFDGSEEAINDLAERIVEGMQSPW